MKISSLPTFIFLILLNGLSYGQEIPMLDTFRLRTGLKVYLLQCGEDSILNVKVVVKGGKRDEDACQVGYSEIIQRLLDISIKEKQLSEGEAKHDFNCKMNGEQTVLQGNCSIRDFDREIGLLNTTIVRLTFDKEKMGRIVSSLVDYYKPENISAINLSTIYRNFILFGDKDPMGRKYCQYQIEKVLPSELREFYVRHYIPENSSLIVSGNFNVGQLKKIIAKHFIKWRPLRKIEEGAKENSEAVPKINGKEIFMVNKHQIDNYVLKWVFPAPSAKSEELPAFNLLCELFNSYLLNAIQSQNFEHLKFRPISFVDNFMGINCYSELAGAPVAVELLESTLSNFRSKSFDRDEIDKAVQAIINFNKKNTTAKTQSQFYDPLLYDFEIRKNYTFSLSNIIDLDLQRVQRKFFSSESYKLIVVGKEHLVSQQLGRFGKVKRFQTSDFETCDESCKEIVIIKYHCESCRRRGLGYVWRFNPADKEAIERARARKE